VLFWHDDHGVAWLARFAGSAFFTRGASSAGRAWNRHWDSWARNGNLLLDGRGNDGGSRWVDGGFFTSGQADNGEHCYEQGSFHGGFLLEVITSVSMRTQFHANGPSITKYLRLICTPTHQRTVLQGLFIAHAK
jgi:hypothetical protein